MDAEAAVQPSADTATVLIKSLCPLKDASSRPVPQLRMRMTSVKLNSSPSVVAITIDRPSEVQARASACGRDRSCCPSVFKITVLSSATSTASLFPVGEYVRPRMSRWFGARYTSEKGLPSSDRFHRSTAPLSEPEARCCPSGWKHTVHTRESCPLSSATWAPVSTSHKWTFLSSDADATVRPSLDKATQLMPSVCSSMRCMGSPVAAFHIRTVLSSEPDTMIRSSADKAIPRTGPVCPFSVCRTSPVFASQILRVLSADAETTNAPSLEMTVCNTSARWPVMISSSPSSTGSSKNFEKFALNSSSKESPWVDPSPFFSSQIFLTSSSSKGRSLGP
mmetsp:Transcript_14325/g.22849  ORF Transcript_14325/g.22849 Transcript_14325/m.22849 type:complete len:336 (-) Transcript_14325:465-1472(-)